MVKKVVLSMVATLLLGCFGAFAQGQRVTGTVTDETGAPVIGAAVVVEGTSRGTTTDVAGYYEIAATADGNLVFSYLGYQSQTVAVGGRSTIDVVLATDSEQIEEVVVQAFGVAKKEAFTGSAATIKSDDLQKTQSSSVANALSGKVAGLQTTQGSGSLGSEPTIRIRGISSIGADSDPLWVVDGIPVISYDQNVMSTVGAGSGTTMASINPNDIESVTVLKDAASSSIYGSRAPFGVILITTKSGGDSKTSVNYSNNFRWAGPTFWPRILNSYDFVTLANDASTAHNDCSDRNFIFSSSLHSLT